MTEEIYHNNLDVYTSVFSTIISALGKLSPEEQGRMLQAVKTMLALNFELEPNSVNLNTQTATNQINGSTFSEDRSMSPKVFMLQKQPQTDVERIGCLAYYLTHYRNMPYFKTADLSQLNTEAAQRKFSNPAVAVDNAAKNGYLVPASNGNKQLSAAGEHFVEALPDREAARAAMVGSRPRRKPRKKPIKKAGDKAFAA